MSLDCPDPLPIDLERHHELESDCFHALLAWMMTMAKTYELKMTAADVEYWKGRVNVSRHAGGAKAELQS